MALTKIETDGVKDDAVTSAKLADSSVQNATIATGAVTTAKINDGAVTTAKIANDAVTTAKIADDAVTAAKIQDNAIGADNIVADAITTVKIVDTAVTLAKLEHGTSSNDGKFLRANNGADPTFETVNTTPEGTVILSTGESGGSKFLREDGDGTCSWQSVPAGGISDFDRWHLTADTSGNTDPIQNNWSRWTGNSGTGTVTFSAPSSGLWTFPSTGFWYIDWYGMFTVDNKAERGCNLYLYATTNNSSYAFVTASETSAHDSSAVTKTWSRCTYVFDVTDTSTHKVKFAVGYNQSANTLLGHGSYLYSNVLFTKLRDT